VFEVEEATWCDSCPGGNKQDPWTGKEEIIIYYSPQNYHLKSRRFSLLINL